MSMSKNVALAALFTSLLKAKSVKLTSTHFEYVILTNEPTKSPLATKRALRKFLPNQNAVSCRGGQKNPQKRYLNSAQSQLSKSQYNCAIKAHNSQIVIACEKYAT